MSKIRRFCTTLGAAGLVAMSAAAQAGVGASGCDDLSGIAETPMVDFQSQIQPIFDNSCTGCHGASGPAGLDLRPGESYGNLVGVISTTNTSRLRVEPFSPESSALFLAVNCDAPAGPGFRMQGTDAQQRALIRDWIAQGALAEPAGAPEPIAVPVDGHWARVLLTIMLLLTGLNLVRATRP
ncbi:hypothetical protein [Wenzhouxiangella sediminis]|uniref:Cytochrome c domain-containing protein n=1 Tax=Wenzhouxiangella sediminis TaxID=1792836 RepID=A0A3E1K8P8_9GAMM|nr:hypothetical protein [Wenzhouxiangella sediminis]RFF30434.1 hypothetical protein DZC52_08085 [Wenzhouxiangella sediminis]